MAGLGGGGGGGGKTSSRSSGLAWLAQGLSHVSAMAGQAASSMAAAAKSMTGSSAQIVKASAAAAKASQKAIEQTTVVNDQLKDLLYDLDKSAAAGDKMADYLSKLIHGVLEGTVEADRAIAALGDSVILLDGKVQHLQGVMADVLPSTGQVQAAIKDLLAQVKTSSEALELLKGLHAAQAAEFAQLYEAWQRGAVSIEKLVEAARRLAAALPGSEAAQLAEQLAEWARTGHA